MKRGMRHLSMMMVCLVFAGCTLPPITRDLVLIEDATFSGTVIPLPLFNVPVPLGGLCNLPDEEAIQQLFRDQLPAFLADRVTLESVVLESVTFYTQAASAGDFGSINEVNLDVVLVNAQAAEADRYTLSFVQAPEGFGDEVVLNVTPAADLLAILRTTPDCAGVALRVSGTTSTEDIIFDVSVRVRAVARVSL